jgi:CubicO group peptidase (beta-lactamase class C family)
MTPSVDRHPDQAAFRGSGLHSSGWQRARRAGLVACLLASAGTACTAASTAPPASTGSTAASTRPAQAAMVTRVVRAVMASQHVRAAIVRVTIDGKNVITHAYGEAMAGVPATTEMHFRNGAVAISYLATLLLELVDEGKVSLDDKLSKWLPEIPYSDKVTLGELAQMTAGYVDYVSAPELADELYADPFREFTPQHLIAIGTKRPLLYRPGTNWNYSHTDYVILGLALEKITGEPVAELLRAKVLRPLGLTNTTDPGTPAIPEPALHAYTSERRYSLHIPASIPFTEDSTYWNPSWTIARGAVETTNIYDLSATAIGIGSGRLLSRRSYHAMTTKDLIGKTTKIPGCLTCGPQQSAYTYGLGIVSTGNWLMQNPLFAGEGGAFAYLPPQKVAIAVAVTFEPAAYTSPSSPTNSADVLWRKIAAALVPKEAPEIPPGQ